jgi:multidrug resistance efflux pump
VTDLFVEEGQRVSSGEPLAVLRNLPLQSEYEQARARLSMATERANAASLHYAEYGTALKNREQLASQALQLLNRNAELQLASPISGLVLTPRLRDLIGSYLTEGSPLLQVADVSELRARIYVSEFDLSKIQKSAQAKLHVQGVPKKWHAQIVSIAPGPTEMDPKLLGNVELKGMNPPHFYLVDLVVQDPGFTLKPGMIGVARVYGERRSLLGLGREMISDFWGRKLW